MRDGLVQFTIPKGEKIYIKLENEKIIELELSQDYPPVIHGSAGNVATSWATNTEVDAKVMRRLSKSAITDMKITIQGTDLTVSQKQVNPKKALIIMNSAGCIAGILPAPPEEK